MDWTEVIGERYIALYDVSQFRDHREAWREKNKRTSTVDKGGKFSDVVKWNESWIMGVSRPR